MPFSVINIDSSIKLTQQLSYLYRRLEKGSVDITFYRILNHKII